MTPRTARRLLVLTGTALAGYSLGWFGRAWGWTPIVIFFVIAVCAFAAGAGVTAQAFADQTAAANRGKDQAEQERDEIAARLAQIEDGARFRPIPLRPRVPRRGAS